MTRVYREIQGEPYSFQRNAHGFGVTNTSAPENNFYRSYQVYIGNQGIPTHCSCPDLVLRSKGGAMQVGTKVTYRHCRENREVQPERAGAIGTVIELDVIDGEDCAKVTWNWSQNNTGFWVRCGLLLETKG